MLGARVLFNDENSLLSLLRPGARQPDAFRLHDSHAYNRHDRSGERPNSQENLHAGTVTEDGRTGNRLRLGKSGSFGPRVRAALSVGPISI